jgi:hypothetical protein
MSFASALTESRLRPWILFLRQWQSVFDHYLCFVDHCLPAMIAEEPSNILSSAILTTPV